ncbi:MAG: T9SS type A sorting domain-containing protein [Aureispira sp.]|nr:T9SS type A sorting domain-containing protein [Aureispira sp.]
MQKNTSNFKLLFIITILSCIGSISYAQNDPATATVINSFPHTISNFNSAGGGSAAGMQGSCHTLACCSVKVFKVIIPSHGFLRADFSNFTPLAGTMIAYTPNVANPTTWADITYLSNSPGNFCGFRDSLQIGGDGGSGPRPYWYGSGATDCYIDPTMTLSEALPPGEYYILAFNENTQAQLGIGDATDITFRFVPFCPQGYECYNQTIANCLESSYTSPSGKVYTTSGSYQDTLLGAATGGLDSLIFTNLTISNDSYVQDTLQDTMLCPTTDTLRAEASTDYVSYIELTKADGDWVEANGAVPALINTNRSVFAWIKKSTTVSGSSQMIVGMNTSGSGNICNLQIGTNEQLGIYDGSNSHYTGVVVTDGQWHYVGYTYDETTNRTKMYVDGVMEASYTNGQSLTATSNRISLGQEFDGATSKGNFLDGILTEVSIWNEVLDSADIVSAMQKAIDNTHPKYANLQAYYPMNKNCQADNTIITDYSGKGNDGTASAADIQVGEGTLEQIPNFNSAAHFSKDWKYSGSTVATTDDLELISYAAGTYQLSLSRDYFTITDEWDVTLSGGCIIASPYIHVDINAAGSNDGTSWANAYTNFQEALDSASTGDTILVAQGTYLPSKDRMGAVTTSRAATFYINKDVVIRGGYLTGGGTVNPMLNKTILSGDLGAQGDASDNSYNVIYLENAPSTLVLEGLVIQEGNANGTPYPYNRGGGIANNGMNSGNSSPTIQNCIFRWNEGTYGGAISNMSNFNGVVDATITGCLFYENTSTTGSAISNGTYQGGSNNSVISNCTFADNVGTSIHNANGGATITIQNSIIWDQGAPIYNYGNETTVAYCLLKSGALPTRTTDGGNNLLAVNPEFVDAANDDYSLKAFSIGVDVGANGLLPSGYTTDLLAGTRTVNATVDLGAIERPMAPAIIYVDQNVAGGSNDGTDWVNAYSSLQAGIAAAGTGTSIWVAGGIYTATGGSDRAASFQIASGVKIYGGFAGGETQLSQRNWATNSTILSGDIGAQGDPSDNSYNIIRMQNVNTTTILDGLIIENGNANGTPYPYNRGGGLSNNGMNTGNSSPTIQNCIFRWNQGTYGGAISNMSNFNGVVDARITGCLFYENTSIAGAAIDNGTYQGGSNNSVISNCTFSDNTGVAINNANGGASITIQNSIIWDIMPLANYGNETTLLYSSIYSSSLPAGTTDGGNNQLTMDPMFVDAANDDYKLQGASPAVGAGSNAYLTGGYTLDLAHTTRQSGATVEMGCYEDAISSAKTMANNNPTTVDENTNAEEEQAIATEIEEELEMSSLEETTTVMNMTLYPNPVQDIVNIRLEGIQETVNLQLLNTAGQTIQQEVLEIQEGQTIQLDMSRLANGIYLLNVQLENGTRLNERVIKH